MNTEFTISEDEGQESMLKNGEPFFTTNFIANRAFAKIYTSCIVPDGGQWKDVQFFRDHSKMIVGTGGCCSGYVIALSTDEHNGKRGKVVSIQAIDFNVVRLTPIVLKEKPYGDGKLHTELGFLATGSGCSGSGVRYVQFKALPKVIDIVPSRETPDGSSSRWFKIDPLVDVGDIWERLDQHKIEVDRERTLAAQKEFTFLNRRY